MRKTTIQVSGNNDQEKPILSVLTKRTYTLKKNKECILSEEQLPLQLMPSFYNNEETLFDKDIDIYPFKPYTDIIVKGYAQQAKASQHFTASIGIGHTGKSIQVMGDRSVNKNNSGLLQFTNPSPINKVALTYENAYGGKDLIAEKILRDKLEADGSLKHVNEVLNFLQGSPYRYPRNPEGKGYIIDTSDETLSNMELPNLEDPNHLLTPENIICKGPEYWHTMPLPAATDWVNPGWFPRVAYFGLYPLPNGFDSNSAEIKLGYADEHILKSVFDVQKATFSYRGCNGASLGLQASYLKGGESCKLVNIHPEISEFVFRLPSEQPIIKVDGRNGKLLKTKPVMHSVTIEPEHNRLSIVWCGSGKAIRPYFNEELKNMPYEVTW